MGSLLVDCPEVTRTTCAPGATAPDHSTSRLFSVKSSMVHREPELVAAVQMPGSIPLTPFTSIGINPADKPKVLRNVATSARLISLVPTIPIVCPVPLIGVVAFHSGCTL